MEDDDDLAVPILPPSSSSEEDEDGYGGVTAASGLAGEEMAVLLRAIANGEAEEAAPQLADVEFWREFGAPIGLHCEELAALGGEMTHSKEITANLRDNLDRGGFLLPTTDHESERCENGDLCARLCKGLRKLKAAGFAPAFIYIFDEAWIAIERQWRLLGAVLTSDCDGDGDVTTTVLEPSMGAHVLSRPVAPHGAAEDGVASSCTTELQRHTFIGGSFSKPHRDHSSNECFDDDGRPTLLSLWLPVTDVTTDNGCMFVIPRESDPLLHRPEHPRHLAPHKGLDVGAAIALAPTCRGCGLAWHGSLVHWGGQCASFAEAEPRAALTAAVRLRRARATTLQAQQERSLPEITLDSLPLPLHERIRHAAGSVLLYSFWYGLHTGVLPPELVNARSRSGSMQEGSDEIRVARFGSAPREPS